MKSIEIFPLKNPITKTTTIPGSKSYTNRALIMAAMTKNTVRIINPLFSDDTKAMIACLQLLGIKINSSKNIIYVIGSIQDIKNKTFELNANLSGTTLRFLLPLLTIVPGVKLLKGNDGLNKRPIKILVDALRELGAKIDYVNKEGFPPVKITSSKLKNRSITLDGSISSQYFSALLMIGPLIDGLTVKVRNTQISKPYIDMTIDTMEKFGVKVVNDNYKKYTVPGGQSYDTKQYKVEGDFSSAGYFLSIAALTKSTITVRNLNPNSVQADKKILTVLKQMGSKISIGNNEITIAGNGVKPITVDAVEFPDQAQTLALLAAFANGKTVLHGIQSLRIKETDRIKALQNELQKMGIKTNVNETTLTIFGGTPKSSSIETYGDHRMAMAFAIAGTKLQRMVIRTPEVVTKTFPNFWKELNRIGVKTREKKSKKIVLIGFMGSGKSTIAPLLAKELGFTSIEMDNLTLGRSREESIAQVFEKFGEKYFRSLEQETAASLVQEQGIIISAGGGVVRNKKTMNALSKNAILVFLSTRFETLQKRLKGVKNRPLWKDVNKAQKLFDLRQPLYTKVADVVIETDNKPIDELVQEIIDRVEVTI